MTIAPIAHTSVAGSSGGTTASVDTTGANLITIHVAWASVLGGVSVADNKGNSFPPRTQHSDGSVASQIFEAVAPTVGSGHTFSITGAGVFLAAQVCAWSGAAASPFDVENGSSGSGTSLQTGNVTPSEDKELLFSGVVIDINGSNTYAIDSGFVVSDENDYTVASNEGGAAAYLIETSAAAKNPTWSWAGGSGGAAASIATYKAAADTVTDLPSFVVGGGSRPGRRVQVIGT